MELEYKEILDKKGRQTGIRCATEVIPNELGLAPGLRIRVSYPEPKAMCPSPGLDVFSSERDYVHMAPPYKDKPHEMIFEADLIRSGQRFTVVVHGEPQAFDVPFRKPSDGVRARATLHVKQEGEAFTVIQESAIEKGYRKTGKKLAEGASKWLAEHTKKDNEGPER